MQNSKSGSLVDIFGSELSRAQSLREAVAQVPIVNHPGDNSTTAPVAATPAPPAPSVTATPAAAAAAPPPPAAVRALTRVSAARASPSSLLNAQPAAGSPKASNFDIMKLTTMAVAGLVIAYVLYRFYGFVQKRRAGKGVGETKGPSTTTNQTPSAIPQLPQIIPATPEPKPQPPQRRTPATARTSSSSSSPAPSRTSSSSSSSAPARSPSPAPAAAAPPRKRPQVASLDDELDGFLGEMQKHEQRLRQMRAQSNGKAAAKPREEKDGDDDEYGH
jgi:hypothetical protein